jgi:hypothetical protein
MKIYPENENQSKRKTCSSFIKINFLSVASIIFVIVIILIVVSII